MRIVEEPEEFLGSTGYMLARVGTESRRSWARMLVDQGLTPHHFGVLMALGQRGSTSQQDLSRVIGIDPRNAVPVIDALEQRGLIERAVDTADRRRHAVSLTAAGRATLEDLRGAGDQLEREFLSALSSSEQATLHRLLRKLFASRT
jgi:DNA-binding MarR family transcriptional regulator